MTFHPDSVSYKVSLSDSDVPVPEHRTYRGLAQQLVNSFLEQLIEINQDVSAQDDIKFIEGTISR